MTDDEAYNEMSAYMTEIKKLHDLPGRRAAMKAEDRLAEHERIARQYFEPPISDVLDEAERAVALLRRVSDEGQDTPSAWLIPGDLYWDIEKYLEGGE